MTDWSLSRVLASLHGEIEDQLRRARESFGHPGTKGDASEEVWLSLFRTYLPARYQAEKAHVVDSKGSFSQQIDVVVFDRQYSPFIFNFNGQFVIPAESVYAVFEAKQSINAQHVAYAQDKVRSVRGLHRTSLPIPHAGGTYPAKPLIPILGGVLTFESDWSPPLGEKLREVLENSGGDGKLDLGCVAAHGSFGFDRDTAEYKVDVGGKPATAFVFDLISRLQFSGTVPMIDIHAYGKWLLDPPADGETG